MVVALGGEAWLSQDQGYLEGRTAAFYHGQPSGVETLFFSLHQFPDKDRIEFTKKHDVVQIFTGREGWEITYRGKKPLPKDQVEDFLRRRDHSIETAIKVWRKDPRTVLLYEGQTTAERHLADQVTLIDASNDAITILADANTHLPLRRVFQWRDPVYKDKNTEVEEYDNYHVIQGFPTPFTVTRFHNDDMVNQRFIDKASYRFIMPPDSFNVDATSSRIKK